MNFNLVTEYPVWLVVICLLGGAAYASVLYYKDSKNDFPLVLKWPMAVLRAAVVSVIAFLLLNPLLKTTSRYTEKPVIIFAQDNSQSIVNGADSSYFQNEYKKQVNNLLGKLSSEYKVSTYSFGDKLTEGADFNFDDKQTDFSQLFGDIQDRYSNRNVGALIIASDGIYNKGLNPLFSGSGFNFPVYTIALGDTNVRKDVILSKVNYNRIAYYGNEFPIEVIVNGQKCTGLNSELTISKGGAVLFRKQINFTNDNYFETVKLHLEAKEIGVQRYRIKLSSIAGEITTSNNSQDIFVDVLEGRQKILMLANSPNPDISAIKQAILSNRNYEVEDFVVSDFDKPIATYNLIILHGLPSITNSIKPILDKIEEKKLPVLYIISSQTSLPLFNNLKSGLSITGDGIIYNEALPVLNKEFSLFTLSDNTVRAMHQFPPLISPYGNHVLMPSASSLFYEKIGSVETTYPLYLFNQTTDSKTGVINGTGLWKWRLKDFENEGNFDAFDEIINKSIQFLSLRVDKSFFRVYCKNNFNENDNIEFDAEVYNESYELINEPEVNIIITNSNGKDFPFVFDKTSNAYHLNAGNLPVDNYKYSARVKVGDKILTDNGEFIVSALNIEKINTIANHNLLYNLAAKKGGEMIYPDQIDELADKITSREDIKPIIYSQKRYSEILNFPFLLIGIILLLTAEWFMRKRGGSY